jgi:hypothetical protein
MSKGYVDRSLKSLNMKWLVMLGGLDVVAVLLFVAPELVGNASWGAAALMRGLVALVLPVGVLLLTGLLDHDIKAKLVYWKLKDPYPGCEAFTRHGPADVRVDMVALKKNTGVLPTEPAEQNRKWFKLYLLVEKEVAVLEAHKSYLMYRDMVAMSIPLAVLVPAALLFTGAAAVAVWGSAILFAVQFLVCCVGARHSGKRFVCTVLAIHSTRKVAAAPKAGASMAKA